MQPSLLDHAYAIYPSGLDRVRKSETLVKSYPSPVVCLILPPGLP